MKLAEIEGIYDALTDMKNFLTTETSTQSHIRLGIIIGMLGVVEKILGINTQDI